MDALELVRRRARERRAGVAPDTGGRPGGWQLVRASAAQAGYDLLALESDDALLAGAEAVLDRGIAAIFYSRQASEPEAAALVAHELGHLDLHEGLAACGREEIDPSSPEEPTPAGVHRVEAYGVREREELQANVYARELLLPRGETRRLFLGERRSASEMASALGLPLDLVRQQLCDSLLTPEPPEQEAEEEDAGGLDPHQRAAAEHAGSPLLLEAGPGTGKTRALIGRIVHLIGRGVDPAAILALTFSNKAAREITDRVAARLPREAPRIWTGTFHAFGLELLRKHHALAGLEPEIRIVDRSDAIALLEELLPALGLEHHQNLYEPALELKEMLAAISRAKDELVDAAGYEALATAMRARPRSKDERIAAERALEVARVYDVYQRTLEWKKAVDFGDLIMKTARLLEAHPAVRDAVRLTHRHVLVDEYQDVNRASARLLQQIAGGGERLWVVGDARQSIYRFRGASASNMARFEEDFPGARRLALEVNYRSSREVVETLERFAAGMRVSDSALPLALEPRRGPAGRAPDVRVVGDRDAEVSAVAAQVARLAAEGVPLAGQAVLCRSNARVGAFSAGLEARGVPVLHLGSLFERDEVRDLLSLLWLLADPRGGALARLAALPDYAVPMADVRTYLEAVREGGFTAVEGLAKAGEIEGLSARGAAGLARLGRDLAGCDRTATPWQIFARYLFDGGAYLHRLIAGGGRGEPPMKAVALYQFLNFVRQARPGGRGTPATRLLDKVRRLVLLAEERDLRQIPATALHLDAVRLMTIHGAKGLEFEAVHLPGLTTASLPSNFRPPRCPPPEGMVERAGDGDETLRASHEAEEECLFFVALSRAKTHLHLYRSRTAGAVTRNPSKFLRSLRLGAGPVELTAPEGGADGAAIAIEGARGETTDVRAIAAFERCPRRYFYARLFGLAGTTRDGAFVKTHRAIYGLLDWLKEQPPGAFPTVDEARARLDEIWGEKGPTGHAFEPRYRQLAETIVRHLIEAHQGLSLDARDPLVIELPGGTVTAEPDLWATLPDGRTLLRVLRTGRKGSFRGDDTLFGLFEAGARLRYGSDGFELEVLHLTDSRRTRINMSLEKIMTRCEKSARYLAEMAEGRYLPKPDPVRCPRCPYFFCCPKIPEGVLRLPVSPAAVD